MRLRLLAPLALAFLAAAPAARERPAPPPLAPELERSLATIGETALRAHIRFLADDLLEGRATATPGYDRAALYVASRFAELGLTPGGADGGYLQPVPLRRALPLVEESSFELERRGRRRTLEDGRHFVWLPDLERTATSATAPVVYVGYGVTAPEQRYDDYRGVDVRGKIVAFARGAPAVFDHDARAYYASSEVKAENAVAHGAVGTIVFRDPKLPNRHWDMQARRSRAQGRMIWLDAAGRPYGQIAGLRANATLGPEGVPALFEAELPRLERALARAEQGRPASFALPVTARLAQKSRHESAASPNVVAVLPGSDPALAGELVVLSAHLDHLGVDTAAPAGQDAVYNGAYDNASGIAALIETARAFAALPRAPRRTLVFLAVTGEENGLLGSEAYVASVQASQRLVANVNLDMFLMLFPVRDIVAFGAEHSSLEGVVERAAAAVGLETSPDPWPEETLFIRSDQYSFVRDGVPSIFLTAGQQSGDPAIDGAKALRSWLDEVYHTPADEIDQPMDLASGVRFARANFLIGHEIADAPRPPTWNAGDFFGERFARARP